MIGFESSRCLRWHIVASGAAGTGHDSEYLLLYDRSLREQTMHRASGVKLLPLRPRKRLQRQVSAEHSMKMSIGPSHGGPAYGMARKLSRQ